MMPKLKNKFRVTFLNIAALASGVNSRNMTLQVTTMSRPELEFTQVELNRYNSKAYVAGKHEWSALQLTVEDDINGLASAVVTGQLETQQRLIGIDLDGRWLNTAATGSDYKFGLQLDQLDGDEGVVESFLYEGAWIQQAQFGDLSYAEAEAVTIALTVRFDHVRKVPGAAAGSYGSALGGFISN